MWWLSDFVPLPRKRWRITRCCSCQMFWKCIWKTGRLNHLNSTATHPLRWVQERTLPLTLRCACIIRTALNTECYSEMYILKCGHDFHSNPVNPRTTLNLMFNLSFYFIFFNFAVFILSWCSTQHITSEFPCIFNCGNYLLAQLPCLCNRHCTLTVSPPTDGLCFRMWSWPCKRNCPLRASSTSPSCWSTDLRDLQASSCSCTNRRC